ncbi:MAG: hypothetical protein HUJ73_01485 [Eubacterium sp.]|nr:hypothetical protein [Eubacterium sp.]
MKKHQLILTLCWAGIGFAAGCVLYLVLRFLFRMDVGFWMTSLLTAGYSGLFIGLFGGTIFLCRAREKRMRLRKTKIVRIEDIRREVSLRRSEEVRLEKVKE